MKISKKWIRLCNIATAVLMLVLLALQFVPFWSFPACDCTGKCAKLDFDSNCPMCSVYYKACVNIPDEELSAGTNRRDYSKEWKLSIQQYVWTPTFDSCGGATEYFGGIFDVKETKTNPGYEFMVKDIVMMPILVLVCAAFGAYFSFVKSEKPLTSVFSLVAGVAGTVGYLTIPVFQLGALWQIHLAISIVVLLISLVPTAEYIMRAIDWCNPKKAQ